MADPTFLAPWEKAKTDFEGITGKSKPKPNGMIAKAFNHSGLTKVLSDADKHYQAIQNEMMRPKKDPKKIAKAIADGKKHAGKLRKSADDYIKTLDNAIKDEVSDKGEKTTYSKGLKFLKERLNHLAVKFDTAVSGFEVQSSDSLNAQEKLAKMVSKNLAAACANAAAAVKKVKSNPTPAQFNELFQIQDTPGRKIQVQLVMADNAIKKGLLPDGLIVDPRFIADKLTPWQAGGKGLSIANDDWDSKQVLSHLEEFNKLLKLSARYLTALEEVG